MGRSDAGLDLTAGCPEVCRELGFCIYLSTNHLMWVVSTGTEENANHFGQLNATALEYLGILFPLLDICLSKQLAAEASRR